MIVPFRQLKIKTFSGNYLIPLQKYKYLAEVSSSMAFDRSLKSWCTASCRSTRRSCLISSIFSVLNVVTLVALSPLPDPDTILCSSTDCGVGGFEPVEGAWSVISGCDSFRAMAWGLAVIRRRCAVDRLGVSTRRMVLCFERLSRDKYS